MTRPARFWVPFAAAFAIVGGVVDLWANFNDTTGDTASEQIRGLGLPDPVLAFALAGSAAGLYVHLKRRESER